MNLPFFHYHFDQTYKKTEKVFFYSDQTIEGINFRHYLSAEGWTRKYTTFDSYDEGKRVFDKIGQSDIPPIPQWVIDQEKECQKYYEEQREKDFHEYMESVMLK